MIILTGFKGNEFVLNSDHIEKVEEALGSTTITLINGNKYIVLESSEEIIGKVIEFKKKIFALGFNFKVDSVKEI
ncbi:MAG: flagellar FlbD family protein [Clostridiaceae bacterium]|nr:flagellar FlbD family protein [Clostridiaceae bacterium]